MLLSEWNWEDALQVCWNEGLEEGMERGEAKTQELVFKLIKQAKTMEDLKKCLKPYRQNSIAPAENMLPGESRRHDALQVRGLKIINNTTCRTGQ
jgi:hypothetical protein